MKSVIKILKWAGLVLCLLIIGLLVFIQFSWDKKYDAPYPNITATTDSIIIARGKHLALGPAHCINCHVTMDKLREADEGKIM